MSAHGMTLRLSACDRLASATQVLRGSTPEGGGVKMRIMGRAPRVTRFWSRALPGKE
jgi:hypothetical protein